MQTLLTALSMLLILGGALAQNTISNYEPVTNETLQNPSDGDWLQYRRTYDAYGHSPLSQVNVDNVDNLTLVWSRFMEPGSNEGTPFVRNGVIFLANPRDVIQAIDGVTGTLIWEYRRQLPATSELNILGEHTRSIALYEDKIFHVTWDNNIIALDAATGALVWESPRGQSDFVSNSAGPIVVDGVVMAGSTCQFAGFGCYVTGHDAESGEELWRNYLIPNPGEPGDETWGGSPMEARWMTGVWGALTYDPETNLVFYGSTGVGPASETVRGMPGATLWGSNTRSAVRPQTGEVVWAHQVLPRDNWDQECTYEMMTIETVVNPNASADGMLSVNPNITAGETRRLSFGMPCKTGLVWAFDAETGEFVYARDTVEQNLVESIDGNGIVTVNEDVVLTVVGQVYDMCPTFLGGRDWPATAYNPENGLFFAPLNNVCYDIAATDDEPDPANVYATETTMRLAPGKENVGRVDAISVSTGETVWSWEMPGSLYAPVLSTSGGLLFTGGADRYFRALDQASGEVVWQTRLPSTVYGHTVSYEVDGRQYIAVLAGGSLAGGSFAEVNPAGLDAVTGSNAIFVFALPE